MSIDVGLGRVLIVEDDPDVADLLVFVLQRAGATEVRVASDGQMGLDLARAAPPDLVLCDLMLPALDGLRVCEQLRSGTPVVTAPVIFLTAAAHTAFRARSPADLGACGVLVKPFDIGRLGADIKAMLAAHAARVNRV